MDVLARVVARSVGGSSSSMSGPEKAKVKDMVFLMIRIYCRFSQTLRNLRAVRAVGRTDGV